MGLRELNLRRRLWLVFKYAPMKGGGVEGERWKILLRDSIDERYESYQPESKFDFKHISVSPLEIFKKWSFSHKNENETSSCLTFWK